jgi:hypothetical protein
VVVALIIVLVLDGPYTVMSIDDGHNTVTFVMSFLSDGRGDSGKRRP